MSTRLVLETKINENGDIIALYNETETWSPVRKEEAIKEIESGLHKYFIKISGVGNVFLKVSDGENGKFIFADTFKEQFKNAERV